VLAWPGKPSNSTRWRGGRLDGHGAEGTHSTMRMLSIQYSYCVCVLACVHICGCVAVMRSTVAPDTQLRVWQILQQFSDPRRMIGPSREPLDIFCHRPRRVLLVFDKGISANSYKSCTFSSMQLFGIVTHHIFLFWFDAARYTCMRRFCMAKHS
jgi:hypothetical protein